MSAVTGALATARAKGKQSRRRSNLPAENPAAGDVPVAALQSEAQRATEARAPLGAACGPVAIPPSPISPVVPAGVEVHGAAGLELPGRGFLARALASCTPVDEGLPRRERPNRALLVDRLEPDFEADAPQASQPRLVVGTAGDHPAVFQTLVAVFQSPAYDRFLSTLEDPFYEPSDRLLVKRKSQVLSHLHLARRVMHLGPLELPASTVSWLATLPEFRGQGFARALIDTAERLMVEDGSAVGLTRTRIPYFFRNAGWAVCGRHCLSEANVRDLLAQLSTHSRRRAAGRVTVRPWRQVELAGLMRTYQENTVGGAGAIHRTEAYWRWLVSRKEFDHIFVAINGPDKFEWESDNQPIVGYAVTRRNRIVELMTSPEHPAAAVQLLARACREAIERDDDHVILHAPPDSPLHGWLLAAGGTRHYHESLQGEVLMVKLFDPSALLTALCDELRRRAEAAGLALPIELGLSIEGEKLLVCVTRRGVKLAHNRLGRSYLALNQAELARLLLGHGDVDEAIGQGRIEASTRIAQQAAAALFPRLPLWRSPLDELMP